MSGEPFDAVWNSLSARMMFTLLHFLWQGTAVALTAAVALAILRRSSSAARYALLIVGLTLMAILPVLTFWLGGDRTPPQSAIAVQPIEFAEVVGAPSPRPSQNEFVAHPSDLTLTSPSPASAALQPAPTPTATSAFRFASWASALYFCGVALSLLRLALGLHGGDRLCRQSQPVTDAHLLNSLAKQTRAFKLRAAPLVAFCHRVAVPTVVGIVRPTILLPFCCASGLTPHQMEVILAHELAHIRRHDQLVNVLQKIVESFLFFHPAVWWLSRRIQIERENCCDDLVLSLGAKPLAYANSLLRVAELSRAITVGRPALVGLNAVGKPSDLRCRIARLLGAQHENEVRLVRVWPLVLAFSAIAIFLIPTGMPLTRGRSAEAAQPAAMDADGWGPVSGGLQARLRAVAANTDEQKPVFPAAVDSVKFTRPADVTFAVELKNVSDKPISLQGTRYGDNVTPPWPGKSVSDTFAPFLFDCEYFDQENRPIAGPTQNMQSGDTMLSSSSGSVETIEPGKSLVVLIRPLRWKASLARLFGPGEYRIRARYRGTSQGTIDQIRKHWPDKPMARLEVIDPVTSEAAFSIVADQETKPAEPAWGVPINGLRAAIEFVSASPTAQAARDTAAATFPQGDIVNIRFLIQNVSDREISFSSETWRQDDRGWLIDKAKVETELTHPWYSGWAVMEFWTLKPNEIAVLPAIGLKIASAENAAEETNNPGVALRTKPGEYHVRYELRFGSLQRTDKDGNVTIPRPNDFQGPLSTGRAPFNIRARRPADNPPTFTARLEFRAPDGKPVDRGYAEVSEQASRKSRFKGEWNAGPLEIPAVTAGPLLAYVRAPGFEETRFYDVKTQADSITTLTLTLAKPVTLRLVTQDGKPVADARVRYFNRSKTEAAAGPYPTDGLAGPVWAKSNANGEVVLDMLQKFDPLDVKLLGENLYWFYIEPNVPLAPLFIGPVQPGDNLGEVKVGAFLEIRGEVRGTPEELAAFKAEWDQPEPMLRGNGESWLYAESKRLETVREGNKLTFRLTALRPGNLRIIARFERGGAPTRHSYTRRDPVEDDAVFEFVVTESLKDISISKPKKSP